ncbi:hypothetical protein MF265_01460 [Serratia marcescens]|uniref:hypothetical protein n=1 Tax=Serratia marcescens TaxID=615 RepID=UPI001EF0A19B|nr:hypothetical protein [Serratia marcescens]ULH11492.1 hypothetical protein MF265_01460 [Serratia marcescens]
MSSYQKLNSVFCPSTHTFPWKPWSVVDPRFLTDPGQRIFNIKPDFETIFEKICRKLGPCSGLAVISNSIIGVTNWNSTQISRQYDAVINGSAVFEASAMFYYRLSGPQAEALLNYLTPRDVRKLKPMNCMFVVFTSDIGTVDDEAVLLRISDDEFLLSSGGCKPLTYLSDALERYPDVRITYNDIISFNIKGPRRFEAMKELVVEEEQHSLDSLSDMCLCHTLFRFGGDIWIVRTKIGMEMWGSPDTIVRAWDAMLSSPETYTPCGWDMLHSYRMDCDEFQFSLYPLELNHNTTLWEVGLGWMTNEKTSEYVGKSALELNKSNPRFRIGQLLFDAGCQSVPFGTEICTEDGRFGGVITSSAHSFRFGRVSAFAHIANDCQDKIFLLGSPSDSRLENSGMRCHLNL